MIDFFNIKNYSFKSFSKRIKKQFLFAKLIYLDNCSIIKAYDDARIFGCVFCNNKSKIIINRKVIINKDAAISACNGSIVNIGEGCQISKGVSINADSGSQISLGSNTTFFSNVLISGNVKIGDGVLFSSNINIISTTHCIDGKDWIRHLDKEYIKQNGSLKDSPIVIGDECWIGLNVVILPGTILGKGCVVGANSVVKGSFADFSIIGGIPAKILKYR